jgi:hypothetical protein
MVEDVHPYSSGRNHVIDTRCCNQSQSKPTKPSGRNQTQQFPNNAANMDPHLLTFTNKQFIKIIHKQTKN